jgi:hypothetical protein
MQGWAPTSGVALIKRPKTFEVDLTLDANDKCNPCKKARDKKVLRLLTPQGTERLLAARVQDLHDEDLQLVDVLTWFHHCFENGAVDWSEMFTVCAKLLQTPATALPLRLRARIASHFLGRFLFDLF